MVKIINKKFKSDDDGNNIVEICSSCDRELHTLIGSDAVEPINDRDPTNSCVLCLRLYYKNLIQELEKRK